MFKAGSLLLVAALSALTLTAGSGAVPGPAEPAAAPTLALEPFATGLTQPVLVTHAGDGSNRVFIVEQVGRIRVVRDGQLQATPFLDLTARVSTGGERGLLGLAFPPGYAAKGYFYVNYTNTAGDTVVSRFQRDATNPDAANPFSEQVVLNVAQPFANHNGGHLAFGPRDRYLYVGMGDGGSAGDPGNRAQNTAELLGKMLRIETERGKPATYTVPADNPFFLSTGARPEIWALGLRNPWRFSFDRLTGDLYTADVGQGGREEVDFQSVASRGGENYGWRIMEGSQCFNPPGCSVAGLTLPVAEYDHSLGCSVTGGYVYRGSRYPLLQGLYLYGDFCSGRIWGLRREAGVWQNTLLLDTNLQISSFGEDEAGELYVADHGGGTISRVTETTPAATTVGFAARDYAVDEFAGAFEATVVRVGDTTTAGTVDYATFDGLASERSDYEAAFGRLSFAPGETTKTVRVLVTDDAHAEGGESINLVLRNATGGLAVGNSSAVLTILDNDQATPTANPIDESAFFVRQQYLDFFNREPDAPGLAFWVNNIESCGADQACRALKRVDTSAAFFLSIEFQGTGYLVHRFHQAAYNTGEYLGLRDFLKDTQEIGRGIVVGVGDWEAQFEARRRAFADEFVTRPLFTALYPQTMTPAQYVDALNANAAGSLMRVERDTLVEELSTGAKTRAQVLRAVAEDADFRAREFNRAFVLMQYFGYMRRAPDDPPQEKQDFSGYGFWLVKLNQHGDYRAAEMVKSFLVSGEYRARFGRP